MESDSDSLEDSPGSVQSNSTDVLRDNWSKQEYNEPHAAPAQNADNSQNADNAQNADNEVQCSPFETEDLALNEPVQGHGRIQQADDLIMDDSTDSK